MMQKMPANEEQVSNERGFLEREKRALNESLALRKETVDKGLAD